MEGPEIISHARGIWAALTLLRARIPPGNVPDDDRVMDGADRAEAASRSLCDAVGSEVTAAAFGPPREDFVAALVREVRTAKRVTVENAPAANCFARGGFGKIVATAINITPAGGRGAAAPFRRTDIVVKAIRTATGARATGAESLIEPAVMTAFEGSSFLMPALMVDISPKTSETRVVLPRGICDVSTIVKRRRIPLPHRVMRAWAGAIACGVAEMHSRGLVHGDVKTGNVIVFPQPAHPADAEAIAGAVTAALDVIAAAQRVPTPCATPAIARARAVAEAAAAALLTFTTVRLSDFGLSTMCDAGLRGVVSRDNIAGYTALYRPPEVWRGNQWGFPADVWALGCTLFDLAFGRTLFQDQRNTAGAEERRAMLAAMENFVSAFDLFDLAASPQTSGASGFLPCTMPSAPGGASEWRAAPAEIRVALAGTLHLSPQNRLPAAGVCEVLAVGPVPRPEFFPFFATPAQTEIRAILDTAAAAAERGATPLAKCQEELLFRTPRTEGGVAAAVAAAVRDATSDPFVHPLAEWMLTRHLARVHKLRSPRIRALPLAATAALCCCTVGKVLRRAEAVRESVASLCAGGGALSQSSGEGEEKAALFLPPSTRDERALCAGLGHRLFPFFPAG